MIMRNVFLKRKTKMERYLFALNNSTLINVGRCADMAWYLFRKNDTQATWCLHLQCPWQLDSNGTMVLSNEDVYVPVASAVDDEDFGWDVYGHNMFDKKVADRNGFEGLTVDRCFADKNNDLHLCFENGLTFQTFIEPASKEEDWRLFSKEDKEPHLVIAGRKVSLE